MFLVHSTMKTEIKQLFPQWTNEKLDRNLTITNDLDSLVSCSLLNMIHGYEINYYFSFDGLYKLNPDDNRKSIGVDLALSQGFTWDNHVTKIYKDDCVNPNSANLNAINGISTANYTDKYAGSTALQIWSYYDIPLPETDEGKLFLLTIDSAYKGHYNDRYKQTHNEYLRQLGFDELIELLDRTAIWELEHLKINEHISFKNGELIYQQHSIDYAEKLLGIKLTLPTGKFTKIAQFEKHNEPIVEFKNDDSIFSSALINKKYINYSILKENINNDTIN